MRVAEPPSTFKRKALIKVRRTLETHALQEGMRSSPNELRTALAANMVHYHQACRNEDMEAVVALDMEFHHTIVASADNGSLLGVWQPTITQMFLRYSRHHTLLDSYAEHEAVLAALDHGTVQAASKLLREHIV